MAANFGISPLYLWVILIKAILVVEKAKFIKYTWWSTYPLRQFDLILQAIHFTFWQLSTWLRLSNSSHGNDSVFIRVFWNTCTCNYRLLRYLILLEALAVWWLLPSDSVFVHKSAVNIVRSLRNSNIPAAAESSGLLSSRNSEPILEQSLRKGPPS